jgi:5'-nucleotidase (lipoprotein e(P4) family)
MATLISCQEQNLKDQNKKSSEFMLLSTAWYQFSAEQKALYYQAFNIAKMRIDQIAADKNNKNPAVVLDIDETVLDNSPYQGWCIHNDSSYTKSSWDRWVQKGTAEALSGALDFTKYAQEKGVEVIYISNRNISQMDATIKNLKEKGFPNAEKSFVFLKDSTSDKTYRREIVSKNYEIAVLIGDNLGDFDHLFDHRANKAAHRAVEQHKNEFGKKFIMLPNPMYGKWERPFQKMEGDYVKNLKKELNSF